MKFQNLAPNLALVWMQSRGVNIKIVGGRESGLMIMLFISFSEEITNVTGNS